MRISFTARESDAGRSVKQLLKYALHLSATQVKRLGRRGGVYLDGQPAVLWAAVEPGSLLEADITSVEPELSFPREDGELEILYESPALLCVNKPAGMLVHPSRARYTGTLANYAAGYLAPEGAAPHAVNRLDRDTSGVVVFAKAAHFMTLAAESLRGPESRKEYLGYLCGLPPERRGVADAPIERAEPGKMLRVVRDQGRPARTAYEVMSTAEIRGATVAKARFELLTGRTHQIRVHMTHLGAPLIGDTLYNTSESLALSRALGVTGQLLHAHRLTLRDPWDGRLLEIEAPIRRPQMAEIEKYFENT